MRSRRPEVLDEDPRCRSGRRAVGNAVPGDRDGRPRGELGGHAEADRGAHIDRLGERTGRADGRRGVWGMWGWGGFVIGRWGGRGGRVCDKAVGRVCDNQNSPTGRLRISGRIRMTGRLRPRPKGCTRWRWRQALPVRLPSEGAVSPARTFHVGPRRSRRHRLDPRALSALEDTPPRRCDGVETQSFIPGPRSASLALHRPSA